MHPYDGQTCPHCAASLYDAVGTPEYTADAYAVCGWGSYPVLVY